ncbi:hypothetical protein GIB67_022583 [Kingdonia uniflora]|uniref:Uncharacterized protein n=1 Tax=Kingdonia uniflora TaxID=39325 RepID=A0A7J7L7K9_9MAGN|nr:hypothetical protein GIB67_022583 [Kingdonia uniflora]
MNGATISNLRISAPGNSRNTDGIDISDSSHIQIRDSFIGTVHGISVGSLGAKGARDTVEDVHCDRHTMEDSVDKNWSKVIGEQLPERAEDERTKGVPFDFTECSTYLLLADTPYEGQHFESVEDAGVCYEQYEKTL